MMYSLQNFGISDFPLTHTGAIKTKTIKDFITARVAIDAFRRERCKERMLAGGIGTVTFTTDDPPGVECPEMNCVVFGPTKKFKNHKGNLAFRDTVRTMVLLEEDVKEKKAKTYVATTTTTTTTAKHHRIKQSSLLIDKVIEEASKEYVFRIYDTKNCWYKKVTDPVELRSQISLAIRYTRKHIEKEQKQQAAAKNRKQQRQQDQRIGASGTTGDGDYNGANDDKDAASIMGLDPRSVKRFKKDDNHRNGLIGGFMGCG